MRHKVAKKSEGLKISIDNDTLPSNRRSRKKVFSDDVISQEIDEVDLALVNQNKRNIEHPDSDDNDGDDQPEVVKSNDASLQALRELHRNVSSLTSVNTKKSKKIRLSSGMRKGNDEEKNGPTLSVDSIDQIVKLDDSVVDMLNSIYCEDNQELTSPDDDVVNNNNKQRLLKILKPKKAMNKM